jgi:hypothetical protein
LFSVLETHPVLDLERLLLRLVFAGDMLVELASLVLLLDSVLCILVEVDMYLEISLFERFGLFRNFTLWPFSRS